MGKESLGQRPFGKITTIPAGTKKLFGTLDVRFSRTASITLRGTYNASATSGLRVNVYYSPDGDNFDTIPYLYFDLDFTAGSTVQETHICDFPEHGQVLIEVENTDGTYSATNISVWLTQIKHPTGSI